MFSAALIRRTTVIALAAIVPAFAGIARADTKALYKSLIDQTSSSMVTVKCVLKIQGGSGAQESEREFTALMIDPKGLVLCSSLQLGTSRLYRRMGGSITPTDIKILIGEDTEGVEARLLTNDPELDLSWLQIKKPDEKGYKFLDLTHSKTAVIGDRLLSARRMDKFFDRALVINEGFLGGTTKKPRELLIPTASLEFNQSSIGMPVFAEDASVIGVAVLQSPDPEDMEASGRNSADVLILPVAEVAKATEKARSAKVEEEEDEDDDTATSKPAGATSGPAKAKPQADAPAKDKHADEEEEE